MKFARHFFAIWNNQKNWATCKDLRYKRAFSLFRNDNSIFWGNLRQEVGEKWWLDLIDGWVRIGTWLSCRSGWDLNLRKTLGYSCLYWEVERLYSSLCLVEQSHSALGIWVRPCASCRATCRPVLSDHSASVLIQPPVKRLERDQEGKTGQKNSSDGETNSPSTLP